jgi:hypothetical protein
MSAALPARLARPWLADRLLMTVGGAASLILRLR